MADPVTPRARILIFIKGLLDFNDLSTLVGVPDIKVRHTRNRFSNTEERPCLALRLVSDEPRDDARYHTIWERVNELHLDMQVDANLPTEISDLDPTGLDTLGAIANAAVTILKDEEAVDADGKKLRDLCDDVVDLGVIPDEDAEADEGRFIHRIVVLYRTSNTDPNKLLAAGENVT